jgi:hypothetical protein
VSKQEVRSIISSEGFKNSFILNSVTVISQDVITINGSRSTWGGSVKKDESFIVEQSQSSPSGIDLKKHLEGLGRSVGISSQLGGGNLDLGESKQRNEWTFERLK